MNESSAPYSIDETFLRLKADGAVDRLPVDDSFWPRLMSGELGDFHNEYLVSASEFDGSWQQWEKHPAGNEIVVLLHGAVDFTVDTGRGLQRIEVREPGQYVFVPKGCWHTADALEPSRMLFITPGEGTQGKPRD